jgi:hypothetical protein
MTKENWERKLFYLLTPALMGDPFAFGVVSLRSRAALASLLGSLRRRVTNSDSYQPRRSGL